MKGMVVLRSLALRVALLTGLFVAGCGDGAPTDGGAADAAGPLSSDAQVRDGSPPADLAVPSDLLVASDARPDGAMTDGALDLAAPDLSMPDLSMPDLSMPDLSMPDLSMPDLSMPDLSMPDLSMPDLAKPDLAMPDMARPQAKPVTFSAAWAALGLYRSMVTGDFDKDGKLDFIANGANSGEVLLGRGDGRFNRGAAFNGPTLATGDTNGDGKLDLVGYTNRPVVMLGNGDGTFGKESALNLVGNPEQPAALIDMNGDGKLDYTFRNSLGPSQTVNWAAGNGNGTFKADVATPFKAFVATFFAVVEINGDSAADVVTFLGNNFSVNMNDGTGGFPGPAFNYGPMPAPEAIQFAGGDFNKDGKRDLVALLRDYPKAFYQLAVQTGKGNGLFTINTSIPKGSFLPAAMAVGDLNGDGADDVVVTSQDQGMAQIVMSDGNGALVPGAVLHAGVNGQSPVIRDFDGDGKNDIAYAVPDKYVTIHRGRGDGTAVDGLYQPGACAAFGVGTALTWIERNAQPVLAYRCYYAPFNASDIRTAGLMGDGTLTLSMAGAPQANVNAPFFSGGHRQNVAGDFDGVAGSEILDSNCNVVADKNLFFAASMPPWCKGSGAPTVIDLDGDAFLDLVVSRSNPLELVSYYGAAKLTWPLNIATPLLQYPGFVGVGDFNRDGKADVAAGLCGPGNVGGGLAIALNKAGVLAKPTVYHQGICMSETIATDVNGDGKLDLLVAQLSPHQMLFLAGVGDGTFDAPVAFGAELDPEQPWRLQAVDLNKDGNVDLLGDLRNAIAVFTGNGDGSFQLARTYATFANPLPATLRDLNGDGRPEYVYIDQAGNSDAVGILINNSP